MFNLFLSLFMIGAILIFILVVLVFSPVFLGVPFMPTHKKQAIKMMELADIKPGMKVMDLGSGAGRLLFLAAQKGAYATGYELNPFLVIWTKLMIFLKGQQRQVQVLYKSIYDADIKEADVIFMFLFPPHMKKLAEKITKEAKSGAKILSYSFALPGWIPLIHEQAIYVYKK